MKRKQQKVAEIDIEMGKKVRVLRVLNGMSQTKLGKKLGVSFQQIQKYENAQNKMSFSVLEKIKGVFGVPWSFFFENEVQTRKLFCLDEKDLEINYTLRKMPASVKKRIYQMILSVEKCLDEKHIRR